MRSKTPNTDFNLVLGCHCEHPVPSVAIDRLAQDKVKEKEKIKLEKRGGMAESKKLLKQIRD